MPIRSLDALGSAFLALFGAWIIYRAAGYGVTSEVGPGSGTFPLIAGLLIAFFSFLNVVKHLAGARATKIVITRKELVQIGAISALTLSFAVIVPYLGMFLPLPVLLVTISLCISWRADARWVLTISTGAIAFTFVCYLIFGRFLDILLPKGPLGF